MKETGLDGKLRKATVVNLFGAPGSGKSTLASGLHYEMKRRYIQAELAREFAKDAIHQETAHWLQQTVMVLAEQSARIQFIENKYDFVITDGPILFSSWYAAPDYPQSFHALCMDLFNTYRNCNIFLRRAHRYDPNGRFQDEVEATRIENDMRQWLLDKGLPFVELASGDENPVMICDWLLSNTPLRQAIFHNGCSEQSPSLQ